MIYHRCTDIHPSARGGMRPFASTRAILQIQAILPILEDWLLKLTSSGSRLTRLRYFQRAKALVGANVMSAFILVQLRFRDRAAYQRYRAAFPAVFAQFKGCVLIADEAPVLLSGEKIWDKVVLLEFPDEGEALRFYHSPEYRGISADFELGTTATFTLVKGFQPR